MLPAERREAAGSSNHLSKYLAPQRGIGILIRGFCTSAEADRLSLNLLSTSLAQISMGVGFLYRFQWNVNFPSQSFRALTTNSGHRQIGCDLGMPRGRMLHRSGNPGILVGW